MRYVDYYRLMLNIEITWEFFLGIVGILIALAYYTGARFSRLEATIEWLAETVRDLAIKSENLSAQAFDAQSPVSLTSTGEQLLRDSGLKSYIDRKRDDLTGRLRLESPLDFYTIQKNAFRMFHQIAFEDRFARELNKFAFRSGTSTDLLRHLGAIYLRDLAFKPN